MKFSSSFDGSSFQLEETVILQDNYMKNVQANGRLRRKLMIRREIRDGQVEFTTIHKNNNKTLINLSVCRVTVKIAQAWQNTRDKILQP